MVHRTVSLFLCAALFSCDGILDAELRLDPKPPEHERPAPDQPNPEPPKPEPEFNPAPMRLRALTPSQRTQVLGAALQLTPAELAMLPAFDALQGVGEFTAINAYQALLGTTDVDRLSEAAFAAAAMATSTATRTQALLGCAPTTVSDGCLNQFIQTAARSLWRRPPSTEEALRYRTLFRAVPNPTEATADVLAALVLSPGFTWLEERPSAPGRYDEVAVASRLSLALWDQGPDAELLALAESGTLTQPATLEAQVKRLLAGPRAQAAIERLLGEYFQLAELEKLEKNAVIYPTATAGLRRSMTRELEWLLARYSAPSSHFLELFRTQDTWVDQRLASLYGLPTAGSSNDVFLAKLLPAERKGIQSRAGLLALLADTDHPSSTLRGFFIYEKLLCGTIGAPPPGVTQKLAEIRNDSSSAGLTERQLRERHLTEPACAGCHRSFDPLGYPLGAFDGIGAQRSSDHGQPIDVSGAVPAMGSAPEVPVNGSGALADALWSREALASCVARHFFRGLTGHTETPWELSRFDGYARSTFRARGDLRALLVHLLTSEAFLAGRFVEAP